MKAGEDCGLCTASLDEACAVFGKPYCELKERYHTDATVGADWVLSELRRRLTADQARALGQRVQARLQGRPLPPPAP